MLLTTMMRKIQEADIVLSSVTAEETFEFAIDLNNAINKLGKYSVMYYDKMEELGYNYQEAIDKLGNFLNR